MPDDITLDERRVRLASLAIAGLAVLADWIGSNQDWFGYRERADTLDAYWPQALKRASVAAEQAGVLPCKASRVLGYRELTRLGVAARTVFVYSNAVRVERSHDDILILAPRKSPYNTPAEKRR